MDNTIENEYDILPQNVKDILDKYEECESYEECSKLVKELETIGWTCDYYLDANPFDFRRVIKKGEKYSYEDLEAYSKTKGLDDRDHTLECEGKFVIGHQIVKLEHKHKDEISTFILTGWASKNGIYECVYTDM
jgi:hypothetical protein